MSLSITQYKDFDPTKVTFSGLKKGKIGNKTIYLQTEGSKKIHLQLPFMRSPYGLSSYSDESSGKTSFSLDLSFDAENEEAQVLKRKLQQLDELIVEQVARNSEEFLGKKFTKEVVQDALYKPLVRPGKEDYADTIKLKVMCHPDGSFQPETYNMAKERVSLDSIEKGQRCVAIVDIASCWVIDNKVGVTCRLQQVLLDRSERLPSFAFVGIPGIEDGPPPASSSPSGCEFVSDEDLVDE